ncbi:hypothetical protein [[Acholeplasma] multilocale]|uniref:hypothetical protein n=1 Tax=[Acholeplasma] multilocale TaxID=264638 RepID=UPI000684A238|nr:hypothetical protein [[Acholeplasma] multilocale]
MRKTTRLIILLLVVAVIYFGYSAWIDNASVYNLSNEALGYNHVQMGSTNWGTVAGALGLSAGDIFDVALIKQAVADKASEGWLFQGVFAHNSLAKSLLDPFKLVLVGGVFAMLVPLTKQLFFGTVIGIKGYVKARNNNVLYNYQKTIAWVTDLNSKLALGDHEQIKGVYATYGGLAFKPTFLTNMMEEIGSGLIRELDLTIYVKPSEVIINSLKEMYEKERRMAIAQRADEMFFDFKRGYEYTSVGSKYSIAYYKALETGTDTQSKLAWKLFSLEMFRFSIYLIATLIPAIIVGALVGGLVTGLAKTTGDINTFVTSAVFMLTWFGLAIALHATLTFTKSSYANMKKALAKPAAIYYSLYILLAITISAGMVGMSKVFPDGKTITDAGSMDQIWVWFSAVGYLILSSCLVLYVISTLMDANKSPEGMTKKLFVDGIVLPLVAWTIATAANFTGLFLNDTEALKDAKSILAAANSITLVGFWIYLSFSGMLLNNIVLPSTRKKMALQAELAEQGKEAEAKKAKASK